MGMGIGRVLIPAVVAVLSLNAAAERIPPLTCHRGGCEYDDNALGSFKDSDKAGLKRFETDFRFTKDHRFVLMHDDTMDRTTTGSGYVEDHTFEEVRKLKLKRSGESVPAGEDVLRYFKDRKDVFLMLEMKTYNHKPGENFYTDAVAEEYCRKLSALARANLVPGTYVYSSTDYRTLRIMRRIDPDAKIEVILYDQFSDVWLNLAKELKCCIFSQWIGGLHPGDIERIHAAGMKVELWPILNMGDYARARKLGTDTVCTDTPKEFTRRITMKQASDYTYGNIKTSWDNHEVRIVAPKFSRTFKLTEKGLEQLSYVRDGVEQLKPSEVAKSAYSDFTRSTAGCLKLGDEVGVRITVLTDFGEEQVDIKASEADLVRRTLPTNIKCVF